MSEVIPLKCRYRRFADNQPQQRLQPAGRAEQGITDGIVNFIEIVKFAASTGLGVYDTGKQEFSSCAQILVQDREFHAQRCGTGFRCREM